jgi:hypothetical protein
MSFPHALCLALLALCMVVRPALIANCELHAILYAHAAQPHAHYHAGDPHSDHSGSDAAHGEHDAAQSVSFADIVCTVPALVLPAFVRLPQPIPPARPHPIAESRLGAPFRPPAA